MGKGRNRGPRAGREPGMMQFLVTTRAGGHQWAKLKMKKMKKYSSQCAADENTGDSLKNECMDSSAVSN